jgi:3',5'-cyclic AMP phosphodiesterase CpdA
MRRSLLAISIAGVALGLVVGGCATRGIPQRLQELPPDFKRVPYLQNVTPTAATIAWQTHSPEESTLRYWSGDSANRPSISDTTVSIDHAIVLDELRPDTEYTYQVRTWGGDFTEGRTFRTAPAPGTRKAFKFLVFGDSGEGTPGQLQLADRMPGENANLAIHVGDVAYDNGTDIDFDFRHFAVYKDLMDDVPFYPSLGNHDIRTEFGRPYLNAFHLPANNPARTERYYSFQYDNVFFVALDSNAGPTYVAEFGDLRDADNAQRRWLEGELKRAAGDPTVDWIVVYFHHAAFSSGRGIAGHGSDIGLQQSLFPLFEQYGVDIVFMGHDHHYERTFPLHCDPGTALSPACAVRGEDPKRVVGGSGTVYVVSGAGGGPFSWRAVGVSWWTAFARQTYQYITVEVDGPVLVMKSLDAGGGVLDEVRFERPAPEGQPQQAEPGPPRAAPQKAVGAEERTPQQPAVGGQRGSGAANSPPRPEGR